MEEKIESDAEILNQSLEALNILKENIKNDENALEKLVEILKSKEKINETFFIPMQKR